MSTTKDLNPPPAQLRLTLPLPVGTKKLLQQGFQGTKELLQEGFQGWLTVLRINVHPTPSAVVTPRSDRSSPVIPCAQRSSLGLQDPGKEAKDEVMRGFFG